MVIDNWNALFLKSSFICLNKNVELTQEQAELKRKISFHPDVLTFHPYRREEFMLGRLCASLAHKNFFGKDLLELAANPDRSPKWPLDVIGSITHNKNWVGAAVSSSEQLLGLGIDIEEFGRTKTELTSHIKTKNDLLNHPSYKSEELLTLIFSIKEALYKALHPQARVFFGFHDAFVPEINSKDGSFEVILTKDLNEFYKVGGRDAFQGRFRIESGHCLSVLEISK